MRKKRGVDAEENKRQAGGSEKDSRANIELEQGGSKDLNGTMFLVASALYCVREIVHLLRVFFNFILVLSKFMQL